MKFKVGDKVRVKLHKIDEYSIRNIELNGGVNKFTIKKAVPRLGSIIYFFERRVPYRNDEFPYGNYEYELEFSEPKQLELF